MPKFMVIEFNRYEAINSIKKEVEAETPLDAYVTLMQEQYPDVPREQLVYGIEKHEPESPNTKLELCKGQHNMWAFDTEEESYLILQLP